MIWTTEEEKIKKSITERTFGVIKLEHDEIEEMIEDTEYAFQSFIYG
jgi:hypothetical protein